MPILKQAKKRVRQAEVRQTRNYNRRTAVRKAIRSVNDSVKAGDKAAADKNLAVAYKSIDMAVKQGIIQKNTAARRKSSLAKMIAGIKKGESKAKAAPKKETAKKAKA